MGIRYGLICWVIEVDMPLATRLCGLSVAKPFMPILIIPVPVAVARLAVRAYASFNRASLEKYSCGKVRQAAYRLVRPERRDGHLLRYDNKSIRRNLAGLTHIDEVQGLNYALHSVLEKHNAAPAASPVPTRFLFKSPS